MAERPLALILSEDELLRELLAERFRQDYLEVQQAGSLREAAELSRSIPAQVVLIDAMGDPSLASQLLDDPGIVLQEQQPPFVLLSSSATPVAIRDHGFIDRVVGVPLSSDEIVSATLTSSTGRARREMRSGVRLRSVVDETFRTKKKSIAP